MIGLKREDKVMSRANHSREESLSSLIRKYISLRNGNIFLFMILSVFPAAICQAFYMKLRVLDIKGIIYTLFFEIDYTRFISIEYDFIIQPIIVMFMLNLGLIGIKFIGWGIAEEKETPNSDRKILDSKSEKLIFSGFTVIYFIILVFSGAPLLMWEFLLLIILFYLLRKTSSKLVIFLTLLLLNIILFSVYYKYFQFNVVINGETDKILTFMAKIGFSWLYILPYNLFVFFPLVISIHFWNFKNPEKYVSSFFETVFHENMVAVIVGLFLNVMLSAVPLFIVIAQPSIPFADPADIIEKVIYFFHQIFRMKEPTGLRTFETIAIFQFWIGSFTLWFTPFFVSLTQLETKFEAGFDRKLRNIIQSMKDHIVIIGFGNLGRQVCTDLIEREVVSLEKDTLDVLTPDLEIRKTCKKLLIVDSNDGLFDRVHTDPILQNVGIARRKVCLKGNEEDILIPAIIGDINSETIKESSQLKSSKFFISSPSDYRATFTLSKFANTEDLNSIISVEDSAQKDYFSPKLTAHDAFLVYPAFQEGIVLGRITSLCYFGLKEKTEDNPKIVIAGEGKQIHYIIETFWMEMQRTGSKIGLRKNVIRLPIVILTDSEEIKKRSTPGARGKNRMQEVQEIIIKRSSIRDYNDPYLMIDVILNSPDRLKTIERIIDDNEPEIIVVTSKTIEKVSKIFHEWVVGIERHKSARNKDYKPTIIVGVLGDEYEEIQDILLYYTKTEPESGLKFPIQYLDAAVRVYDDSTEQIGGLAQAFARKGPIRYGKSKIGEIHDPFALYCCIEDAPGSLGYQLSKLAGMDFLPLNKSEKEDAITLHFYRYQNCSGSENTSFLANAELKMNHSIKEKIRLSICLFQSETADSEKRKSLRDNIAKLLDVTNPDQSQLLNLQPHCSRRINCSISSYLRKVENLTKNRDYYKHLEDIGKLDEGTVEKEIERFFIGPRSSRPAASGNQEEQNLPKAAILVCCRHSRITGSIATAVNNLLFRKIERIHDDKPVADVTYLRAYGCYNPAFSYVEFYGNFVNIHRNKRELLKKEGVIESVLINVVTEKDAWLTYARKLCKALNDIYEGNRYELWIDDKETPFNIAVIREKFMKEDILNKISLTCRKKDCIIHSKMRLLKEKIEM